MNVPNPYTFYQLGKLVELLEEERLILNKLKTYNNSHNDISYSESQIELIQAAIKEITSKNS